MKIRFIICSYLILLQLLTPAYASDSPKQCLKDFVYNILLKTPKTGEKLYNDQTAVIWFPKAELRYVTHTEMLSQREIFETFQGRVLAYDFRKLKAMVRMSPKYSDRGIVVYYLNVTKEESKKLNEWLYAHQIPDGEKDFYMTCISGTCEAYRNGIDLNFPFPFNTVPSLNAIYLTFLKTIKHPRIARVEYIGQPGIQKNLISTGIISEVGLSAGVFAATGYFVVWAVCGNQYEKCHTDHDPKGVNLEDAEEVIEADNGEKLRVRKYYIPVVTEVENNTSEVAKDSETPTPESDQQLLKSE